MRGVLRWMQVERDNLYSAFYKLTDSRSQITSYVFDVGAQATPSAHNIVQTQADLPLITWKGSIAAAQLILGLGWALPTTDNTYSTCLHHCQPWMPFEPGSCSKGTIGTRGLLGITC